MIERNTPSEASELHKLTLADLREFRFPQHDRTHELHWLYRASAEQPDRHKQGLVIGRFQPLHYGHIYNWKMALAVADSIIIGIGSANVGDSDNPFSINVRERLIKEALAEHNLTRRVSAIVHLDDFHNDELWLKETLNKTGNVDIVVGNNEWVNGIFEDAGLAAIRPPLLERGMYEGKLCRAKLRTQGKLPPLPVPVLL